MNDADITIKLVAEVKSRPLLYNYNLADYTNKVLLEKAWSEISNRLHIPVTEAKERWRNIRSAYIRSTKPKGMKPKKTYYLKEHLQFVVPFMRSRPPRKHGRSFSTTDGAREETEGTIETMLKEEPIDIDDDDNTSEEMSNVSDIAPSPEPSSKYKLLRKSETEGSKEAATLNQYQYNPVEINPGEVMMPFSTHPMHYFFLSLMGEFDNMTEKQTRTFKIKVLELIDEMKRND